MNLKKKKILIISMTAGFGHIRAGEALLDFAKENLPDIALEHVDIINIDKSIEKYARVYDFLSKKFPFMWKIVYEYFPVFFTQKIAEYIGLFNNKIKRYISLKNPTAIIFTNATILPIFASYLKKISGKVKIGVVVTDYHAHPYYKFPYIDYYFVPNLQVGGQLEALGIKKEKIAITGIPINPRFYIKENIGELKLKYGINNNYPVVLFIASFKISRKDLLVLIEELLDFEPVINLIFIANGNDELYNVVKDNFTGRQRLLLVHWTYVMEEYMKISDAVISKSGGLTVSECLTLKKPLIIVNPIPGQEEYNAEFVKKNNFGKRVNHISEIAKILPTMISYPKNDQAASIEPDNPSKKIFQYF
ncbi:MAG: hypothetical protein A2908_01510 [Candidatus Staskawiczbacteria bacterium RIFCSPLOWO2_01_FULL_38_12b]|uniref:UDP-N-acetylglucosamine--LPS N-acetylglucosamine transferase n=1 Tax=Candidatus Staskawiczbacteria bacterium RIFCSPLOWO2_01_FULL_38_12b TaxID=1802214 RepID=A0A1G2IDG1_9BACT|nr:MAG: hypothetical protein A2908_01510 [Candidatus Staskawiczbacteria bacterium RIFCSPLOWO2_01_FULL_38_12b]